MECNKNRCQRYTLPVLSSNLELKQSASCATPIPYQLSLNMLSTNLQSNHIYPFHRIEKETKKEKTFGRFGTADQSKVEDLPQFDPTADVLYIASTLSDR